MTHLTFSIFNSPATLAVANDPPKFQHTSPLVIFTFESEDPKDIFTVIATGSSPITFSLSSSVSAIFAIDASTGLLRSKVELDADTGETFYSFHIFASDGSRSSRLSIFIFLQDVNNHPPVFTEHVYNVTVPEDIAIGAPLITIEATDDDLEFNVIQYFIVSGDDTGRFSIDINTGEITIAQELDYETTTSYTLTIQAFDNGDPPLNDTATVVVMVTDVNDNDPIFTQSKYTAK